MLEEIKNNENTSQVGQQIIINQVAEKKSNGTGTAGFVLAILGIAYWIPFLGWLFFILWLLGLILSFAGVFKKPRGLAIAGLVISILVASLKWLVFSAMLAGTAAGIGAIEKSLEEATKVETKVGIETTIQSDAQQNASASTKNEDFQDFIQKFTSDKNFQLSRIKFPLSLAKSKNEWKFLDSNDIFKGVKSINGNELEGKFVKESNDKYVYTLYYLESELIFGIIFTQIDREWLVSDIFNYDSE